MVSKTENWGSSPYVLIDFLGFYLINCNKTQKESDQICRNWKKEKWKRRGSNSQEFLRSVSNRVRLTNNELFLIKSLFYLYLLKRYGWNRTYVNRLRVGCSTIELRTLWGLDVLKESNLHNLFRRQVYYLYTKSVNEMIN